MPADDLTIEVTITSRQSRDQAILVGVGSVVILLLPFVSGHPRLGSPSLGVIGLCWAAYLAVQARRKITRTTLHIDRTGLTTERGLYDCSWDRAVLIWVGAPRGPLSQPQLLIYTRAGVSFARRSQTRLHPERSAPLPHGLSGPDFCARLGLLVGVPVVDGRSASRRRTEQDLMDPTASASG